MILFYSTALTFLIFGSPALADNEWLPSQRGVFNIDTGLAGAVRAHPDSILPLRVSPGMLAIVPRYQIGVSGFLDQNIDNGFAIGAVDSTEANVSLGVLFVQNHIASGLQSDQLPGWKLPNEEFETQAVDSILGGSIAFPILNRSWGLGFGGFYRGYKTDVAQTMDSFELNVSLAGKSSDQLSYAIGVSDSLDMAAGRALEMGIRWGLLEPSDIGPPWENCRNKVNKNLFRSTGGISFDYKRGMGEDRVHDFLALGADFPMSCKVFFRGGIQHRPASNRQIYGAGISWDNTQFNIGYDVQLSDTDGELEQRHIIGLRFRVEPWGGVPRAHLP